MNRAPVSAWRAAALVGRGVALEMVRRQDLLVVALLLGLFLVGALAVRLVGIENPATGTFVLNLGLTLAYLCAHVLTLLMAARQLPDEIERRTLHPLLARPLDRGVVLLGKWGACAACGTATVLALGLPAWCVAPHLEAYHPGLLAQLILLQPFSLALVAALALAGSLLWPRGVNLVVGGGLLLVSDQLIGLLRHGAGRAVAWCAQYLPDFSRLNLITRYTDGQDPLSALTLVGLLAYAAIFIVFLLSVAEQAFRRRTL